MSLQTNTGNLAPTNADLPIAALQSATETAAFVDRRRNDGGRSDGKSERRQFGSSHAALSESGRELAAAIDQYKISNHRRYITCDEMLTVINELGYARS